MEERWQEAVMGQEGYDDFACRSADTWSYITDIGLDIEVPGPEGHSPTKKKKGGLEKRMAYKYPVPRNVLRTWHQCIPWGKCRSFWSQCGVT